MGNLSKDKGTYSSRINQIVRQAEKVPGPGKYTGHEDWRLKGGSKFGVTDRNYKSMNKTPASPTYERKDVMDNPSNFSKDVLSKNPRVTYGNIPKGKKRSYLDQAVIESKGLPGVGHYNNKPVACDRLDTKVKGVTSWEREVSVTKGKGPTEKEIGPNHYDIKYSQVDGRGPNFTVPKSKGNNFVDKAVSESMMRGDAGKKKDMPGPGTYNLMNVVNDKISVGTKHIQLRNLTRSPASGYL